MTLKSEASRVDVLWSAVLRKKKYDPREIHSGQRACCMDTGWVILATFPPEKINFKVPSSPQGKLKLYSLGSQKRLLIHTGHECVSSVLVSS